MGSLFLLALVFVIALVAFVVIYSRTKRQAQNAARAAERRATGERLHRQAVREPVLAAEEADQQRFEPDPPKPEEVLPKLEEERHKAEGEHKRSYRNQFAHQYLQRGPVMHYLQALLSKWR